MRLDFAVLADAAHVDENGKLHIHGIFDQVASALYPARQDQMTLVLRLVATAADEGAHQIRFTLLSESDQTVLAGELSARLSGGVSADDPDIRLPLLLNLSGIGFPGPGRYTFLVEIDSIELARLPVTAKLLPLVPSTTDNAAQA